MRASATRRRRPFAGPVRVYRSIRRVLRFLEARRALLLLFSLIVTLNLTLICQGHDTSNGHLGPHVTLLFGSFHAHSASIAETVKSVHVHAGHSLQKQAQRLDPRTAHPVSKIALYSAGANTVGASQTAQADAFGLASLGWVSLIVAPLILRRRRLPLPLEELLQSQSTTAPESPPPRPSA